MEEYEKTANSLSRKLGDAAVIFEEIYTEIQSICQLQLFETRYSHSEKFRPGYYYFDQEITPRRWVFGYGLSAHANKINNSNLILKRFDSLPVGAKIYTKK